MKVTKLELPEVLLIEPRVFGDDRGFFFESYNDRDFRSTIGVDCEFVQDNHSKSTKGVLRGLHYQIQQAQGKLVRVVQGRVFDVAVDLRRSSPNFGKWVGAELNETNKHQLWVPAGFAHGFIVLSETAEFLYKTTDYYAPEHERCILWNDPDLNIRWPIDFVPQLSQRTCKASDSPMPAYMTSFKSGATPTAVKASVIIPTRIRGDLSPRSACSALAGNRLQLRRPGHRFGF